MPPHLKIQRCELGTWLHGKAKSQIGHLASYVECVQKHAAFHVEAGKVAAIINAKYIMLKLKQ